MSDAIIILGGLSIILSIYSVYYLGKLIYDDYEARAQARARYEKNPDLDLLAEDFYVPNITVGSALVFTVLWILPGINIITSISSLVYLAYIGLARVWNNPVIDW